MCVCACARGRDDSLAIGLKNISWMIHPYEYGDRVSFAENDNPSISFREIRHIWCSRSFLVQSLNAIETIINWFRLLYDDDNITIEHQQKQISKEFYDEILMEFCRLNFDRSTITIRTYRLIRCVRARCMSVFWFAYSCLGVCVCVRKR